MGPLGPSPRPHLPAGDVQGTPALGWRPTPTLALQGPPLKDLPWWGGVLSGLWGGTGWVVAGVEAQGAPGGGSGMALVLLLHQTPSPSSS